MDNKKKPQVQATPAVSTQPLFICLTSECTGERTFKKTDDLNSTHAGHDIKLLSEV